ncbi:hypothetical protein [Crossiella cryophila]|uniref:Uncharacterized protein n=1 Tax=Crossiella cryophila TaxID=43355 RepID=A0A7W7FVA6_9PSEU|nr:hypothetical protein [Crossiella cryophila]MBB4678308.1 hypothetical protein [Crossiella cryophila]
MRTTAVVLTVLLASAGVSAVATAAPEAPAAACTWRATPVPVPAGADPAYVHVSGADGRGNYSGYYGPTSADVTFYRWVRGVPVKQAPAPGVSWTLPVDENAAGVVLLRGADFSGGTQKYYVLTQTRQGVYRQLTVPPGLTSLQPNAINNRGDVVASANRDSDGRGQVLLWRAGSTQATVIDPSEIDYPAATDIDEDGTVLLTGGYQVALWHNGTVTKLPKPESGVTARGIANGRVLVLDLRTSTPVSYLWEPKTNWFVHLDRSGPAHAMNKRGLVSGSIGSWSGAPAVWHGTKFLAELPVPAGASTARATVVADDGTIFGETYQNTFPFSWTCR